MNRIIKKIRIIFIFLSLIALLIVISDYISGHTNDNLLTFTFCTICLAYHSMVFSRSFLQFATADTYSESHILTILSHFIYIPTLLFDILLFIEITVSFEKPLPYFHHFEIPFLRAPPLFS